MPKSYTVAGQEYQFPDSFDDAKVQGILTQQGVIKAPPSAPPGPQQQPVNIPMYNRKGLVTSKGLDRPPDFGEKAMNAVLGPLVNSGTSLGRGLHGLVHPGEQPMAANAADIIEGGAGVALPFAGPSLLARPFSALAGGLIGAGTQKLGEKAADLAGASPETSRLVGDVTGFAGGPLAAKGAAAAPRGIANVLGRRAMGITGKMERNGANPLRALFNETTAIRPEGIAEQAGQKIASEGQRLTDTASRPIPQDQWPSLTPAVNRGRVAITNAAAGNDLFAPHEWNPMVKELTEPQPGFTGRTQFPPGAHTPISFNPTASSILGPNGQPIPGTPQLVRGPAPTPEISPRQSPADFLGMKRRFGENFTKFDQNNPRTHGATQVGNEMHHELSEELNKVPGIAEINQNLQDLIPLRDRARMVAEHAGPGERVIDRFTRSTGGMVAPLLAFGEKGPLGAAAMMTAQELASSPTAKMVAARPLFDLSKGMRGVSGGRASRLLPLVPWKNQ